jgi:hypothetical protein
VSCGHKVIYCLELRDYFEALVSKLLPSLCKSLAFYALAESGNSGLVQQESIVRSRYSPPLDSPNAFS